LLNEYKITENSSKDIKPKPLRNFTLIAIACLFHIAINAQPSICPPDAKMTSFCKDACIICDIDGFKGRNNSNITGEAPSDFCTFQVHHMQWLGFIAGTPNLKIEVAVSNCVGSAGLEVGIYEGIDCKNYKKMSDCNTDIAPNTKWAFTANPPLTVGQYYYWVMDGNQNDICDYTIKVIEGSTKVAPLTVAPIINIPNTICQDVEYKISTPGVIGATIYDWFVDGVRVGSGFEFNYKFLSEGEFEISLQAKNVCDKAPIALKKVLVNKTPRTTLKKEVCFEECYNLDGKDYCKTGKYEIFYKTKTGCDSIVTLDLLVNDLITIDRTVKVCEGDTLKLGTGKHWLAGPQIGYINDANGCRIKVNLTLELIKCKIKTGATIVNVKCNKGKDGKINFRITNGTPPISFSWYKLENPNVKGIGNIIQENTDFVISDLDEGHYIFEVKDTFGNVSAASYYVGQPTKLISPNKKSTYGGGYNITCFGLSDGSIEAQPSGGTAPYSITWQDNQTVFKLSDLKSAGYSYTITDGNGCKLPIKDTIIQPQILKHNAAARNTDCSSTNSGIIDLRRISGGAKPYKITINNQIVTSSLQSTLTKGLYNVVIQDTNNCNTDTVLTIDEAEIPIISIDSIVKIDLGDSITLKLNSNLTNQKITWNPDDYLSCKDCSMPTVFPLNTITYTVSSTSKDNCTRNVKIKVEVIKKYDFTFSNIISPNGDNTNDFPRYFADKSVDVVEELKIFDRWGNLFHHLENGSKGVNDLNFDKDKKIQESGVYAWIAKVRYIDGESKTHTGSITFLK
jgi:hypothetical protein